MRVEVIVKAGSKHHEGVELVDGIYHVRTKSPAIEGRANSRVVELLAEFFGVSKSRVKIIRGETAKRKLVLVDK